MKIEIKEIGSTVVHEIGPEGAVLGRGRAGTDIVVRGGSVSKEHARIFFQNGGWFIQDLGSANGTFVGDKPVTEPAPLNVGTHFTLGKKQFQVVFVDFDMDAEVTKPAIQTPSASELMKEGLAGDTMPQKRPTLDYSAVSGKTGHEKDKEAEEPPLTPKPIGRAGDAAEKEEIAPLVQNDQNDSERQQAPAMVVTAHEGVGAEHQEPVVNQMPDEFGTLDETHSGTDSSVKDAEVIDMQEAAAKTLQGEDGKRAEVKGDSGQKAVEPDSTGSRAGEARDVTEQGDDQAAPSFIQMNKVYLGAGALGLAAIILAVFMFTGGGGQERAAQEPVSVTDAHEKARSPDSGAAEKGNVVERSEQRVSEKGTPGSGGPGTTKGNGRESLPAGGKAKDSKTSADRSMEQAVAGSTGEEAKVRTESPWQAYSRKLAAVENAISQDPRLLKEKVVFKLYEKLLKVTYSVEKKYAKKVKKQPWKKKLFDKLMNLALLKKAGKIVDNLFVKLCGENGRGCVQ